MEPQREKESNEEQIEKGIDESNEEQIDILVINVP